MKLRGQLITLVPPGIDHTRHIIHGKTHGQRVHDFPTFGPRASLSLIHKASHVAISDFPASNLHACVNEAALRMSA
ncbi:hypothetical protein AA103581_2452 [Gluconobacter wancherniae NBRC 103581]|nr:hypothetical protein AA103581_2452 [Gluconobacter wancherniae NBRC 103581]